MTSAEKYEKLVVSGILDDFDYNSEDIREPLIEHVGNLPIIAAYLHQFVEHRESIDLGEVLIMLAVHDIGETDIGDMLTYAKTELHANAEVEVAKKKLPDYLFKYFEEIEARENINAKFAKACDSIAPLLHEMILPPKVAWERLEFFDFNLDKLYKKKKSHFEWDKVLDEIFEYITAYYRDLPSKVS